MSTGLYIFIISAISGVIYLLLGFLLSYRQKIELINGVDFSKLTDVEGFCKYMGNSLFASGFVQVVLGFMVYTENMNLYLYLFLFIAFCSLPIFHFIQGKRKFSASVLSDGRN